MKKELNRNIFIADYYILYLGSLNENRRHRHYALPITVSLNKPFTIQTKNHHCAVCGILILDSNAGHTIACSPDALQRGQRKRTDADINDQKFYRSGKYFATELYANRPGFFTLLLYGVVRRLANNNVKRIRALAAGC